MTDVDTTEFPHWKRIDAHLCMVLKNTIHASLKPLFRAYGTSCKVWEQAKLLYTNDTQRLYGVCQDLLNVVASRTQDLVADYVGKVTELFHEFNDVLPPASTPVQEIELRSRFFMVVMLHGLADKYFHVCDQILGSTIIPNFTSTCSTLLCVPCQPSTDPLVHANDSSALVSHRDDRQCSRKLEKGRHKCDHCGKFGHKIDRCYALHGRPSRSAAVAHTDPSSQPSSAYPHSFVFATDQSALFNEFLKWSEDRKLSSSTASVAHTGTSFVGLTQSLSVGPWVFDSGATDHITGNKSLFSSLSSPDNLPSITMANGSHVSAHGVGTVDLFPFLSIDNVLYVPRSSFNLLSISCLTRYLDCVISFTQSSVCLQDQNSRQVIGTGCESHGLYHLCPSSHVGAAIKSPSLLLRAQLGHPSLAKLQ